MNNKKTARTGGTARGGHSGNGHTKDTTPADAGQVIYTRDGKIVGTVYGGVFVKRVVESRHMLKRPVKAWSLAVEVFDELRTLDVRRIEVRGTESGKVWSSSLAHFATYCKPLNRGYGEQLYLPLSRWHQDGKPGPDAEADPDAPRQLALFAESG